MSFQFYPLGFNFDLWYDLTTQPNRPPRAAAHLYVRRIMDDINKLLTLIELNLTKLGRQYKSGQAVLIHEALQALAKVRHLSSPSKHHLTSAITQSANVCPTCDTPMIHYKDTGWECPAYNMEEK